MREQGGIHRRGTPLAMLAIVMVGWVFLRAATWDNPLAFPAMAMSPVEGTTPALAAPKFVQSMGAYPIPAPHSLAYPHRRQNVLNPPYGAPGGYPPPLYVTAEGFLVYPAYPVPGAYIQGLEGRYPAPSSNLGVRPLPRGVVGYASYPRRVPNGQGFALAPPLEDGQPQRANGALASGWSLESAPAPERGAQNRVAKQYRSNQQARPQSATPGFVPVAQSKDRWLLDVYGFYRQGSSALSVTQGRQPIYGASQLAANLQWRARPSSSHDPRVYARAYHALVPAGESEISAGASVLPIGKVPVRVYTELRAVRNPAVSDLGIASQTDLRPAAYAATEIPPLKLPLGFSLEAYGAGGYVGGKASTYFLDGQATATHQVTRIGKPGLGSAAVSLGGGVWGGAQEGVHRVDIGPTLRFDVNIGDVPARVSVDYREKVAGDADPNSGVAATVSTRF